VFNEIIMIENELDEVNSQIEKNGDNIDELIEKQASLQDKFERLGGLTYKSRVRSAIIGLGFEEKDFDLTCDKLSGGQHSKISLAKLLLSGSNFLLLDEPTNHLDIKSVEWLEDFLNGFNGTVMIISHDRYFLDKVTTKTMEIENGRITLTKGNYSHFLEQKKINAEIERRHYENTMQEVERIEGIIAQQRQWNKERNIRTANSKQKQIDRMLQGVVVPDKELEKLDFEFELESVSSNDVLMVSGLSKAFDGKTLFNDVDLHITRGEKVFLLGDNGTGKTTMLKILMGKIQADAGEFDFGASVKVGYFDQTLAGLDLTKTVLEDVWDAYPKMTTTQVRNALAGFLFKNDDVNKKISNLSGGERARVALLKLMLSGANFLLLDEPTNHLDIASRQALENAFSGYDGTVFAVSHDRYFINKLATRIIKLNSNGCQSYNGNYDYYIEKSRNNAQPTQETVIKKEKVNDYKLQKEIESRKRKLATLISKCEKRIEKIGEETEKVNAEISSPEISSDYNKIMELTQKLEILKKEEDEMMVKWEEAQQELEKLENN
ncbi:MAG: ABC-F family ATP-binding cassette domain-containing protein, partial [Clostridiales bacterium]|nr:ABC-F family ATP-binding cassette domain-containing protein [Clostridiales bacterium]